MLNWFKTYHNEFGTSPFYAVIDEGRLEEVVKLLQ